MVIYCYGVSIRILSPIHSLSKYVGIPSDHI